MNMRSTISISMYAFTLCLVLPSRPVRAEQSARELLDKSRDFTATAHTINRVDTTEQTAVIMADQRRAEQKPQTNVVTIQIDMSKYLARQTATILGKELIMLKQGEKSAMKLGNGLWEIPKGPFENLAKDMGNLFVCEIETPETLENAPVWKVAGVERLGGQDAFVI